MNRPHRESNVSVQAKTDLSPVDVVTEALEHYANRGVFRGFGRVSTRGAKATYKILWHREQMFELAFDANKGTLRIPIVLPDVPADSAMYKEFKQFLRSRQSDELPLSSHPS